MLRNAPSFIPGILAAGGFIALVFLQLSGVVDNWNRDLYDSVAALRDSSNAFSRVYNATLYLTRLGDTWFCTGVTALVLFWSWARRRLKVGLGFTLTMLTVGALNSVLKIAITAPRPEIAQVMPTLSFPSGHASGAAALWTMLAVIFASGSSRTGVSLVRISGALLIAVIALSRVVIGAHWPLDIAAGLLEGLALGFLFHALIMHGDEKRPVISANDKPALLMIVGAFGLLYIVINGTYSLNFV